ncbi:hypothetical protein T484DRAFT_1764248 [Baffinella frigidus]|nr:hypothetical protein T484DRAFT_1764248 [Cryptophyta sp. CCMP2293]
MVLSAGDAYGEQWGTRKEELERDIAEEEERIVRMRRAVDPQDAALASGEPVQGWFRQRMSSVFKTVSSKSKSQAAPAAHVEGEWTHGRPTPSGSGGTHATDASPSAVRAVASWLVGAAAPRPVAAPLPEVVAPPGIVSPPVWEDERTASATNVVGRTAPPPPVAASPENTEEHEDTLTTAPPARRRSTLPVEEHLASRAPSFARASAAPAPRASSASAAPVADAQLATAGRAPRASASAAPGVDAAPAPLSSPAAVVAAVPSVRQNIAVGVDAQQAVAAPAPRAPSPPVPAPPRQRPPAEQPRQAVHTGSAPRVDVSYAAPDSGPLESSAPLAAAVAVAAAGGAVESRRAGRGRGEGNKSGSKSGRSRGWRREGRWALANLVNRGGVDACFSCFCLPVCIRESPSLFGKEIGTIEPGEYVEVVDSKFSWNSRWLKLRFWVDFSTFPLRSFRWSKEAWVGGKELLGRADAYPGGIDPPISSSSDSGRALPAARWVVAAPGGVEVQTGAAATAAVASSRSFREVLLVSHQENGWVKLAARGSSGALGRHLGGEEWVRVRGGGQGGRAERVLPLVEAQKVVEDWVVTWPGGITVRATPSFSAPRVGGSTPPPPLLSSPRTAPSL